MTLGERLRTLLDSLPLGWSEAELLVTVPDVAQTDRTALILAPLTPGRSGSTFRVTVQAGGRAGPSRDAAARLLARLDHERIDARLSLGGHSVLDVARRVPETKRELLAESWDAAMARLPADWSDLYAEVELASSDELDRAALLLSPVNPFLHEGLRPALRFRAARRFGYGVAPGMARRCLARLDERHVSGRMRVLRVACETSPVLTQGPVWREGGKTL